MSYRLLVPILGREDVEFFVPLGQELENRGNRVEFVTDMPLVKEMLQNKVPGKNIFARNSAIDEELDIEAELNRIQEAYKIPSFYEFCFAQRVYTPWMGEKQVFHNVVLNFLFSEWLLDESKTDYIIQHEGAEILRRVLHAVGNKYGVTNIWAGFSPIKGCMSLYTSEDALWDNLKITPYDELSDSQISQAKLWLSNFRQKKQPYTYKKHLQAPNFLRAMVRWPAYKIAELKMSNLGIFEALRIFFRVRVALLMRRCRALICKLLFYPSIRKSAELISRDRYIFFPIQYRKESRVTVRAPFSYSQEFIIEIISRVLPYGYKLLAKDHPEQLGDLSLGAVRRVAKLDNVLWLNPEVNSHKIIENSAAVVVVNNTAGYEAILYGKPVVVLGKAFYGGHGVTIDVRDFYSLPEALQKAVHCSKLSEKDVIAFLNGILEASYPGVYGDTSKENVEHFTSSILKFIEKHGSKGEEYHEPA